MTGGDAVNPGPSVVQTVTAAGGRGGGGTGTAGLQTETLLVVFKKNIKSLQA